MRQNVGITEQIAHFVVNVRAREVPEEVKETAKEHLLDGLATMLGGVPEAASRLIRRHVARLGGRREATILGTRLKAPCQHAALANAVQGHVLDYDDTQLATSETRPFGHLTHPTTPVLAASLATAERLHSTGMDLLEAYIAGVEVACRLADAIDASHYLNGFHPTGTLAAFGATAACCRLLDLDETRIRWALGITASLASGVRANRGTMTKSLNAGRAAENGVLAARLASEGFSASSKVFEDPMGYLSAASQNAVDRKLLVFGHPYFFSRPGVAIKPYACAVVLHPSLDVILDLVVRHDIKPQQVRKVRVGMSSYSAAPLVYPRPATGLQGKFSMPFSAAVAILDRKVALDQYTDHKVRHPKTVALMKRVELYYASETERFGHEQARANVEIFLKDGRIYRERATVARGHPMKPLSRQALEEKFRACASRCLEARAIQRLISSVRDIEHASSVSVLVNRMIGKGS